MKNIIKFLKINYLKILLVIIPLLFFIFIFLFVYKINVNNKVLKTESSNFYQYFVQHKYEYNGILTIDKSKKITDFKLNNEKISLLSSPIYYKKKDKAILPTNMSLISYKDGFAQNLINYYSYFYKTGNYCFIQFGKNEELINDKFLYDGEDLYVFFENVSINIGETTYNLKPMSYVILNYRNKIEIYDYKSEPIIVNLGNEDVYAISNSLKLNLSLDSITINNRSLLLYKKINDLPKLRGW